MEHGKVSHDHHRVTKGVIAVIEMVMSQWKSQVTVTAYDKEVS